MNEAELSWVWLTAAGKKPLAASLTNFRTNEFWSWIQLMLLISEIKINSLPKWIDFDFMKQQLIIKPTSVIQSGNPEGMERMMTEWIMKSEWSEIPKKKDWSGSEN